MSGLLQVGAPCSLPSCNVNDFLPTTCQCKLVFCRDHILPDSHACSALVTYSPLVAQGQGANEGTRLRRCDISGCSKPTLFAFTTNPEQETCDKCLKAFCANHRHPDSHSCVSATPHESKSTARAILEKNFGPNLSAASSRAPTTKAQYPKKKLPTDPRKLEQYLRVRLMKMRHSAVPADPNARPESVPQESRVVAEVMYSEQRKTFWFNRNVSAGKAIDLLTLQFKIMSSAPMRLVNAGSGDEVILANDQLLTAQVMDGEILFLKI